MEEEWTCGKGLAASAWLPAKLADMLEAMADTLHEHRPALNTDEPAGAREDAAYLALVTDYRDIVARLRATAARLESYRDLAMASHDEAAMANPGRMAPFARLVQHERDLAKQLAAAADEGAAMLQ